MTEILDFVGRIDQDGGGAASTLGLLVHVTVLLLAATAVAIALRRSSAAVRHLVWTLSLVGVLLLAPLSWIFPGWRWAVLPQRFPSPSIASVTSGAPPEVSLRATHRADEAFHGPAILPGSLLEPPANVSEAIGGTAAPSALVSAPRTPQTQSSWPTILAAVWAMGSFLGLAWLGIGILAAVYVARGAQPVEDSRWHETLRRLLEPGGQRRPIDVRQSASLSVPMAWGLRRPVILVPAASATWSDEAKRSVLLHELGHIRRGDCLAHLVGRLACAVYWFHPLVWLASRALRKTAERAADDLVLSSNVAAPDYAEHLVGIAAQLRGISLFGHAALPMAGASDLEGRVLALLDEKRNHRSLKRSSCYALLISATFFLVPCALLRLGHAQSKESQEPTSSVAETPSANDPRSPGKGGSGTKAEKPQKREKEVPPPPPRANATSRAATSPPAPVKTLLVSGVVVDENGKPAAGVSVRAFAQGQREPVVQSDAAGHFQLHVDRDRAGGLALVARTADGAAQAYFHFGWNVDPATATLPPARLTVVAARSVVVQVVDGSGQPVADAVVGAVVNYAGLDTGRSDLQGKFTLRIPADAPLQNIYAFKSGLGLDYLSFPKAERATTGDQPQPPDLSRPQILRLTGARTVGIKLVDPEARPISGIVLRPWYFQKPQWGRHDDLNIGGVKDFQKTTDAAGNAVFDWIPAWNKPSITFWPSGGNRWSTTPIRWDPQEGPPQITVRVQRTVPVRGQVRHKDGSPAAGILIQAEGEELRSADAAANLTRPPDHFRGQTWTDDNGRFEIRVNPDLVYLFAINDERWAAAARGGVAARPDTPVDGIDFQLLRPPTRLHGQLTLEPERKPWPGQTITLAQQSPDPQSPGPSIPRWTTTDAQGRYRFAVGPGRYELWGPGAFTQRRSFTVTDEEELTHDLDTLGKDRGMITVRVVDGSDPPRPVARAQVVGVSLSSMSHEGLKATTNDEGWFRVERWLDKMIVVAHSKDNTLGGSAIITADEGEVTIPLQPAGTAKGQVIDQATGQPAADRPIRYEVPYRFEFPSVRDAGSSFLVGGTRTDAQGRFQIAGLVPGLAYRLTVPLFKDTDPVERHRYDELGKVTVKSGETVDLGNVKFRRDFAPGEMLDAVLANRDPVDRRLKEWADEGHKRGKRVLIMFWDPTDEASRRHLTGITHNDLKPFADYRVISSPVDSRQVEAAKAAYAKKWESDLFAESWPLFCVLETDGSTLAVKNTREFVKQDRVDDSLVREFVQRLALKRPG